MAGNHHLDLQFLQYINTANYDTFITWFTCNDTFISALETSRNELKEIKKILLKASDVFSLTQQQLCNS